MNVQNYCVNYKGKAYCALWNAAWTRAKQYDFYTDENEFRR